MAVAVGGATFRWVGLMVVAWALCVGLGLFLAAFFPTNPSLADRDGLAASLEPAAADPVFDRLVLVVVDALRADYVFGDEYGAFFFFFFFFWVSKHDVRH